MQKRFKFHKRRGFPSFFYIFAVGIALILLGVVFFYLNKPSKKVSLPSPEKGKEIPDTFRSKDSSQIPDIIPPLSMEQEKAPKIAIVIDDLGPDLKIALRFLDLPIPITVAILPYYPNSLKISKEIKTRNNGTEVILHLPLEPEEIDKYNPGEGVLKVSMKKQELTEWLKKDLDFLSGIRGVSSHMGSRFTQDKERMGILFSVLKERGFYFLDSLTTPKSVSYSLAKEIGVKVLKRGVFLDNDQSVSAISHQVQILSEIAERKGKAIGIGHPHRSTLLALEESIPYLKSEGFEFVSLSTLLE